MFAPPAKDTGFPQRLLAEGPPYGPRSTHRFTFA